jgi:hypothetical protein
MAVRTARQILKNLTDQVGHLYCQLLQPKPPMLVNADKTYSNNLQCFHGTLTVAIQTPR